jgi:hypothetical protein
MFEVWELRVLVVYELFDKAHALLPFPFYFLQVSSCLTVHLAVIYRLRVDFKLVFGP